MEIVVAASRIATMDLSEITDENPSCFFVIENCLNSVLFALDESTTAILDETERARTSNMKIFLYLLIAASCALLASLFFLVPAANKVAKNKQEVLELFT